MAIRSSGYYNNPAFAQAASNLASLFAPPSGADAAGWAAARERDAQAAKVQAEMRRADERRRYVDDPGFDQTRFDRLGVADGTYAPNQSYYAVDQTNATSRANNAADNAGSLARQYAEPILLNEGQTAVLPAQTQKATSLGQLYGGGVKLNQGEAYFGPSAGAAPAAGATPRLSDLFVKPGQAASAGPAPATPRSVASGQPGSVSGDDATAAVLSYMQSRGAQPTQGAAGPSAQPAQPLYRGDAKAPTSDEIKAQVLAALAPGEQRAAALGSTPVEAVVTPNGPRNVWQADSIGQVPYTAPSATSLEGDNYLAAGPNGQEKRFVGRPDAQGRIIDVNTGEVVPNVLRKEGTGGGMSFESGKDGSIRLVTGNGAGMTNSRVTDLQRQETESGRAVSELSTLFDTLRPDDLGAAGNVNEILTNYGAQMFPSLARPDVAGTRAQMEAVTLGIARTLVQDDRMSDADRR
ncbi:MAG TPA: hypothetical protein VLA00_15810, partial [Xanthobacteraceae bacterium]|nr:hypothetical protein [Xanthobacteraceae bacterium]